MAPHESGSSADTRTARIWAPIALGVAVLALVGVVLALTVFSSSSDDDAGADYRARVQRIVEPVIAANRSLSRGLTAVHGTNPADVRREVAAAQSATIAARGGLNALTVPGGSAQLALDARGTLTREATYLAAVKQALADPGGGSAAQTETLAGNLVNALDTIAPPDEDWAASVAGADALTAWAPRAARTIRRRQAAARARRSASREQTSGRVSPPSVSGGTSCGDGLYAGPNTSCPFAANVRRAYYEAPGASATVAVYSPVTGETYSMSCAPAGSGVTCSGGNDASVTWTY
jgi:hypothetical protein